MTNAFAFFSHWISLSLNKRKENKFLLERAKLFSTFYPVDPGYRLRILFLKCNLFQMQKCACFGVGFNLSFVEKNKAKQKFHISYREQQKAKEGMKIFRIPSMFVFWSWLVIICPLWSGEALKTNVQKNKKCPTCQTKSKTKKIKWKNKLKNYQETEIKLIKCIFFLNLNIFITKNCVIILIMRFTMCHIGYHSGDNPLKFWTKLQWISFCDGRAVIGGIGYSTSLICLF